MNKHRLEQMSENEFDAMLERSISDIPPENIVNGVTPWKKAMNRVLIGMVLNTIKLNFWCLDYILPTVGMILMLLGFRALRNENKWFKSCFVINVIQAVYGFQFLILNTTIAASEISDLSVVTILMSVIFLLEMFCFWRGFVSVQKSANMPKKAGSALALLILYAVICVLAVLQLDSPVVVILLIIYVLIMISIYKMSKLLDKSGYVIEPASVKTSDRSVVLIIVSVLAVGFTFGYLFGNGYEMDWKKEDVSQQNQIIKIKRDLIDLGFPEYVLNDLTDEEIAACDGAVKVFADTDGTSVGGSKFEKLHITAVAVKLPDEGESWRVVHHFMWDSDAKFCGTESLQIWPTYHEDSAGEWKLSGEMTGRVLYDENGETFTSPYNSLESQTFTSNYLLLGKQTNTDVFASFSMPKQGENCRGYVTYGTTTEEETPFLSSWLNYTHQTRLIQYPVRTAAEQRMTSGINKGGAFSTWQTALQFNTAYVEDSK